MRFVEQDESFDLQVLLAGAVTTIVECKPADTAGDVLTRLDIPASHLHRYSLATPASSALDSALVLYVAPVFLTFLFLLVPTQYAAGPSSSTFVSADGTTSSPSYGWSRTHRS